MSDEAAGGFRGASLRKAFTAFQYRDYRLWFAGQLVSILGSWMQSTALGFLVFELTRSATYLGYVAVAAGLPSLLFMPFGGVLADRISRKHMMFIAQCVMMALAAVLSLITFLGVVEPWHVVWLAFLMGIANAFDAPARHAFVLELVERRDLTNAIAMNSTVFNAATAIGPAAGGLIYAFFGPAWCFAVNAVSYSGVLVALAMIRPRILEKAESGHSILEDLREGLRFTVRSREIRTLILLITVTTVFGMSFATLMPAWAVRVLGGDSTTNGFLQSARGVGALAGSLFLASLGQFAFRGRLLTVATFFFSFSLLLFSLIRTEAAGILALIPVGAGLILVFNLCNSLLQTLSPDALRGRVLSIFSLAFFGFMPLGGMLAGVSADLLGEPVTIGLCAGVMLLAAVLVRVLLPKMNDLA